MASNLLLAHVFGVWVCAGKSLSQPMMQSREVKGGEAREESSSEGEQEEEKGEGNEILSGSASGGPLSPGFQWGSPCAQFDSSRRSGESGSDSEESSSSESEVSDVLSQGESESVVSSIVFPPMSRASARKARSAVSVPNPMLPPMLPPFSSFDQGPMVRQPPSLFRSPFVVPPPVQAPPQDAMMMHKLQMMEREMREERERFKRSERARQKDEKAREKEEKKRKKEMKKQEKRMRLEMEARMEAKKQLFEQMSEQHRALQEANRALCKDCRDEEDAGCGGGAAGAAD